MRLPADLPTYFTTADAAKLGLTTGRLTRLTQSGQLVRLRQGLYTVPGAATGAARRTTYCEFVAASLTAHNSRGGHAIATHLSAAGVHDLPLPLGPLDIAHLTRTDGVARGWRQPGLWVHHTDTRLPEVVEVDGIEVSGIADTVADCLRTFGPRVSVPIADAALHRARVSGVQVRDVLAAQRHWYRKRINGARAMPLVDGRRESWLESYAAALFDEWGIDPPTPQLVVLDERGRFVARADAGWPGDATLLELDGKQKYLLPGRLGTPDPWATWEAEKAVRRHRQPGLRTRPTHPGRPARRPGPGPTSGARPPPRRLTDAGRRPARRGPGTHPPAPLTPPRPGITRTRPPPAAPPHPN